MIMFLECVYCFVGHFVFGIANGGLVSVSVSVSVSAVSYTHLTLPTNREV